MAALMYPAIDPIAFRLGPLAIRWYGLAYVVGFVVAGLIIRSLNRTWRVGLTGDQLIDIVFAAVIGLIVGARLGYVVLYGGPLYLKEPLRVFATWDGGMSFHGGLAGILLAGWFMSRRLGIPFLRLCDLGAVGAPVGLLLGRLSNVVNDELWGRVTTVPWGMVFPSGGPLPRHPSQLYEAFLEGFVLLAVMLLLSRRKRADGFVIGTLLTLYGVFRILVEFVREPDTQLGFIVGSITMGQMLTIPVLLAGVWLLWRTLGGRGDPVQPASGTGAADDDSGEAEAGL
jgi:phosphatidylglycerol:prolipoprotein diacylglycerol transferase